MTRFSKRQMANRFGYSPFIRLLLFNVRFRAFVIGVVALGLLVLLALPRMWKVSPAGFEPEIRISLVDMWLAGSLQREATRLAREGNHDGALQSWAAAIATYRTKPALSRGYLRTVLELPISVGLAPQAVVQAGFLLRLTHTNQADVELVARVYDHLQLPAQTVELLRAQTNTLDPNLQIILARALFDVGAYAAFEAQWRTNAAVLAADPELELKRAAVREGSSNPDEAAAARLEIEQAALSGTNRAVANRLLLRSAARRQDVAAAQRALNTLVGFKADRPADHAALWRALIAADRRAEAGTLIQAYTRQPATVTEAAETYDLALESGQTRRAEELLDWSLENQGFTTAMCSRKAAALVRQQAWADLRQLAVEIRLRPGLSTTLNAFSYYIEGRASLGENLLDQARRAFARLGEFDYDDPTFALSMADTLIAADQSSAALPLLAALESKLANAPEFWTAYGKAASAERNSVLLLRAAEESYRLDTNDLAATERYVTALVMQRANPALALQLSSNLVNRLPDRPLPALNYAAALLLNARVAEGEQVLARLDPGQFTEDEANSYYYIAFNAAIMARQRETAVTLLEKIKPAALFPPQLSWLQAAAHSYLGITNLAVGRN